VTMPPHMLTKRVFGGIAMLVAIAFALGCVLVLALGWVNDPNDHLLGLFDGFLYVRILGLPGIGAFVLGRLLLRPARSPSNSPMIKL
jgi:hypothetical protein